MCFSPRSMEKSFHFYVVVVSTILIQISKDLGMTIYPCTLPSTDLIKCHSLFETLMCLFGFFSVKLFHVSVFSVYQGRIQDFHRRGRQSIAGVPTYNFTKISKTTV